MDYIRVRVPDQSDLPLTALLKPHLIDEFTAWLEKKYRNKKRVQRMQLVLGQFRLYVGRQQQLVRTEEVIPKKERELVLDFLTNLTQKQMPAVTVRNYKSDLLQFFGFLSLQHISMGKWQTISASTIEAYCHYLQNTLHLSSASMKRKLSSLRSFRSWGEANGHFSMEIRTESGKELPDHKESIDNNRYQKREYPLVHSSRPPEEIVQPKKGWMSVAIGLSLLVLAAAILRNGKSSPPTPLMAPIEAATTGKILHYEGRLLSKDGRALTEKQSIRFQIWDAPTRGAALYDSQSCLIEPDQKGVFSTQIGSTCGKPIPPALLSPDHNLYLGMSVDGESEMVPRQPVATVGYAANAQKLQGHSLANPSGPSSIPYINDQGQLALAAASPMITSSVGTFTLEGRTLLLQTASGSHGSLTLAPDDGGAVNMLFTAPMISQSPGFVTLANPNILSGSLIHITGSPLTSGYNFLELVSGANATTQFAVDAAGNTTIAGSLSAAGSFSASSSGIIATAPLVATNLIYDGGLGIYGSKGNAIPVPVDFTKPTRIEFSFKTGNQTITIDSNINDEKLKFYRAFWTPEGNMGIMQCTPTCIPLGSSPLPWTADLWHHGFMHISTDGITWDIDNNKARIHVALSSDIQLLQKGFIRFTNGSEALANLRISQTADTILTAGSGQVGGALLANGTISSENQIRPGSFSSAPSSAGNGAMYFNTSDNMLYYWNGTSWLSDTFWIRQGNSLLPNTTYAAALNIGIGTTSPSGRLNVADTNQEQLRLSYDSNHYAKFTASSSGTMAIDPTSDLLVAGNLSVGDGGLLYPSENSTHAEQHSYFLSADTSGGGQIRTNATGFAAGGSDFAERFLTDQTLAPGDIVTLIQQSAADTARVGKSTDSYAANILGVVSDRAAFVGGVSTNTDKEKTVTVGLLGQIPVHVTTANGPIHSGDPLTSSSIPGVAMKATATGPIIGRAMAEYTNEDRIGSVLTFVRSGWYEPSLKLDTAGDLLTLPIPEAAAPNSTPQISKLSEYISSFFQSHVLTAKMIVADSVTIVRATITNLTATSATVEQLRAGIIETADLHTNQLTAQGEAHLAHLQTDTIKPSDSSDIHIELPSSPSAGFGHLLITDSNKQTVATIDAAGNATFSGSLTSQEAATNNLQVQDNATIAGTLYADHIVSQDVTSLQSSFSTLLQNMHALLSPTPAASAAATLAQITPSPNATPAAVLAEVPSPPVAPPASATNYQYNGETANTQTGYSDNTIAEIDTQLASAHSLQDRIQQFLATSSAYLAQSDSNKPDTFAKIPNPVTVPTDISLTTLQVIGSTTLADTAIAGQLFVDGTLLLENHTISSLSDTLNLTAEKAISLMGSKLVVDAAGNLTTSGSLMASSIITDTIKTKTGSININLDKKASITANPLPLDTTSMPDLLSTRVGSPESGSYGTFQINGAGDQPVAAIDAAGNIQSQGTVAARDGHFTGTISANKVMLATDTPSSQSAQINPDTITSDTGIPTPAIHTHDSAGSATIPAGSTQLTIYSDMITERSLAYITATSPTQNRTIYVADKVAGSHIIIALDSPITTDIRFNWWIIN